MGLQTHILSPVMCVLNGDGEASFQGCLFYVGLSPHIDEVCKYGLFVMVGVSQCVCVCVFVLVKLWKLASSENS
jgi:hypothetical protein